MSGKNKGRSGDRTIKSTIVTTASSKVIMSEQTEKDPVVPVVVTPAPVGIIATDATAAGIESKVELTEGETTKESLPVTDQVETETPVAEPAINADASDIASAAAALEPIAPSTIAPELDVIAPPIEVAIQSFDSDSVLPAFLARQRGYLADYTRVMCRENRAEPHEMGWQQRNLYQVFIMLFELSGSEFLTALDDLLQFINANRDFMFSDKYMFRAMDLIAVDQSGLTVFKQLMVLMVKIADPADRALIRNHLDLNTAVRGVRNGERALALITEFLNK